MSECVKTLCCSVVLALFAEGVWGAVGTEQSGLLSIDTGYTISKVRTAQWDDETFIIASSYEGTVLALSENGRLRWEHPLSGFMNHDLWCDDINGDDADEVLVANADGTVYCLSSAGALLWQFKPNEGGHLPPMYAVCVIHDANATAYVVCGGFDKNLYYLNATGQVIKTLVSSTYSKERPWGDDKWVGYGHTTNFIRPIPQPDGSELLAVLGTCNHMQSRGSIYQFEPLADQPLSVHKVLAPDSIGDFHVCDPDGDGKYEVLLGTSALSSQGAVRFDPESGAYLQYPLSKIGKNGYRVTQVTTIPAGDSFQYFMICGTHIILRASLDPEVVTDQEKIACSYAFNDLWKDPASGKLLLASSQSGGSCVHIINPAVPEWKTAFAKLEPPGKIATLIANTAEVWRQLSFFRPPTWERKPLPVYLTAANETHPVAQKIIANYDSPVFLNSVGMDKESVDWRYAPDTALNQKTYRERRDRRMKYVLTQQQVLDRAIPEYNGHPGIAYWAGHGNDPYYYQGDTHKKILAAAQGKKTVMIWPEMNGSSADFEFVMNDLIYPLAEYAQTRNGNIHVRNKNIFWLGAVYLPAWSRLVSGEFSNVFVTSMEETSDKTQDLSVVGRMGLWASGALDAWGMRCSRDNPSFDRSRQHSYQQLPNHFLRTTVYNLASGATHTQNTYNHADYMSLIWELIAKGALYVPKREEILSWSPVHLSMKTPDPHVLEDAENNKWTIFYDRGFQENNPFVFSRMNGTWMAAPVTPWDFSRYAAGVKDRRQNFIPPYPNGTVLITPPQQGVFADPKAVRGALVDHLHPLYRDILKEYVTDGRHYYSADGQQQYAADEYYQVIEADIKNRARLLPLTVSGNVAWVTAQTAPKHLRLTLIDSGYLNPQARKARVHFHSVHPVQMVDLLDKQSFDLSDSSAVEVNVPCGLFRLIDIKLKEPIESETPKRTR